MALPTSQAMRELGARLVTPELIVFPVRHHSPACAWQLRRLLAECTPSAVLVEGPRSFTSLLPHLAHAEARMPLAIYTYAVRRGSEDEPEQRRAAYYPFCDYSPELVALRDAASRGIPARFIDLDFAEQCGLSDEEDADEGQSLLDERHYSRSRFLQALAQQLGCRDHEELWEHLFELPASGLSLTEFVAQVATYCQLSRLDTDEAQMRADGTLQREAEMAWHIRDALSQRTPGTGPVLAVVGGFHAVVLPELVAAAKVRPSLSRKNIAEEECALIRYSFDRLDRLNGYASGMTSPAWHQSLWEQMLRHDRIDAAASPRVRRTAALGVLTDIAVELRSRHNLPLPMPALGAAYEQALRLAQLRRRSAPAREDVQDAVISCFVKGDADADGALVMAVTRRVLGGIAVGNVPPGASTPPLVKDFRYRVQRQRLKIDDTQRRRAVLDLYRRPAHRLTSRLLHGLSLLGVPFAVRMAGPDFVLGVGLDRLQEHWEYAYSAAIEAALVEASVYGVSVALAVANRFAAKVDRMQAEGLGGNAREGAALMTQACVLGLHDRLPRLVGLLRGAIGADAGFDSVAAAVASLGLLWESREPLEARDVPDLLPLLAAAYERAIYLGRELRGAQCEAKAVVQALLQLRELLASSAGASLDASLYWAMLDHLKIAHESALIRGAAFGLCYSAGRADEAELGRALHGNLSGLAGPDAAVAFLRGLLETAREAAWQQQELLKVLDGVLQHWDEGEFVTCLPELRLAFAVMTPKETDRIACAVAQMHGARDLGALMRRDIGADAVARHLQISGVLREVLAADGLAAWVAA